MNLDARVVAEKNAIPGAEYHAPKCGVCGSRRTERVWNTNGGPYNLCERVCHLCGNRGRLRVTPRGCFVEAR